MTVSRNSILFAVISVLGLSNTPLVRGAPRQSTAINAAVAAAPPADYTKEAFVIEKSDIRYNYHSDGTWDAVTTVVVRVQSQAGIQQFGTLSIPYESSNQQVEFSYVRVRKPDGTLVANSMANMQDVSAGVTLQAPLYSDLHVKQLPVIGLNPGDTLEYQLHVVENQAEIPNQFWLVANFITEGIALSEHVEIHVPSKKYVKLVSADVQPAIHQDGVETVYEWNTSHLREDAVPDPAKKVSKKTVAGKPSIQLTTFHNWQELGEWYRPLVADRVVVTPAILKQVQEITRGLTTDDAKQRAIYTYVSTQFRYISLSFGIGRLQPHFADSVLQNKFGDCKDKHTVFAALMQAAGYEVWPALIGSTIKLDPDVPSPAQFDHMISVLPQSKNLVWLDTTEEVAPFGMLMSQLRDKQALIIPTKDTPRLEKTPVNPPFPVADTFHIKATLDNKAVLTGHTDLALRGDIELLLRAALHATPQESWNKLGQNISYLEGFAGEVSNFQADNPDDITKPFHMQYDYVRRDYGGGDGTQISPPLPPVPFLLGETDKQPEDTIPLGAPGERNSSATVDLPKGDIATLVADDHIETDFAEYHETSSVKDGALIAQRVYRVKIAKLPTARWEEYLKFIKAVDARENLMITLAQSKSSAPATGTRYVQAARELVDQAYSAKQANHLSESKDFLDRAKAINPTQWGVAATYGDIYYKQNDKDRAIKAYQEEMVNHPDNLPAGRALAGTLIEKQRLKEAADVLEGLLQYEPNNEIATLQLAYVRLRLKLFDNVETLLNKVPVGTEGKAEMQIMLGLAEFTAGQKQAAIATLETGMRAAKQPMVINNAAYQLADHDIDIEETRTYAQKALEQLELTSSTTTLTGLSVDDRQATAKLASISVELGAMWDTVGWIDYKLGRYVEAKRYLQSAWQLRQDKSVGDHLARLASATNGPQAATSPKPVPTNSQTAGLAANASHTNNSEVIVHAQASGSAWAQVIRIPGFPKTAGSAQFFVLLTPRGVEDVRFISGSEAFRNATSSLKVADYGPVFPDTGPEKILRRGTLSCPADASACEFVLSP